MPCHCEAAPLAYEHAQSQRSDGGMAKREAPGDLNEQRHGSVESGR